MPAYSFEQDAFVIEQFDSVKPFSSFLPGMAGLKGIPMWTFYVNRGQAICSFGIKDKNSPIMEFSPANITYKNVPTAGFRTFIKIQGLHTVYEPFQSFRPDSEAKKVMRIRQNELSIEETHDVHGLRTSVSYFNLPGEDFAALVRRVQITNTSDSAIAIELLDGMPEILPYGVENSGYKEVGNLLRSWMEVYNMENGIPYYKVRSSTHDEAEVSKVNSGHFYLSFSQDGQAIKPIVDFEQVFGSNTSLAYPDRFASEPVAKLMQETPYAVNKVPCGFTGLNASLAPGETVTVHTLVGHVNDVAKINRKADRICSSAYVESKHKEAAALSRSLTDDVNTATAFPLFDEYSRQSYMDNFLRGGYPFIFDNGREGAVVHLYSRKHGDLERDYNFFSLAPEYYSQGNGNFRDMNQNRRNDVFFNPKVGSFNIRMFFSLMQADGYNPLSVEGTSFKVKQDRLEQLSELLQNAASGSDALHKLQPLCDGKYTPGKIMNAIADQEIALHTSEEQFLKELLSISEQQIEATFGEGFWSDHWTYNMDLVDSYLSIFPDKKEELLFRDDSYTFFDSPVCVLPRSQKYGITGGKVRQFGAITEDHEKLQKLGRHKNGTEWLRTEGGVGSIYRTNLFVKMVSLSVSKFATLDPYGMGVEMEANKPGWNDAMNGLPGLFGSGMSETLELKRMVRFLIGIIEEYGQHTIRLPEEIADYLSQVYETVRTYAAGEMDHFRYWDQTASIREQYRDRIRYGITGIEKDVRVSELNTVYRAFLDKLDEGIDRAVNMGGGVVPTYFRFEAENFEQLTDQSGKVLMTAYGLPAAKVTGFHVFPLPHFLEAPARGLKLIDDSVKAREMYDRIKATDLYDRGLGMYKTSVSLDGESDEIGRIRAFTAGWLERESVFLHMSYKYLLSLLKSGLYEPFFEEIRSALIPFLDPAVYGRSTLENSSFIASTVNPDPHVHGRGFVARLSGSTAEFLSMWITMMAGKDIFRFENNELQLQLSPILPGWLFDERGEVSFTFLSTTNVIYRNKRKADTYGEGAAMIQSMILTKQDGSRIHVEGSVIAGELAEAVRNGDFSEMDVTLQ